ncbi:hypothetical protein EGW08_017382, partial [Elysia chlorotica]
MAASGRSLTLLVFCVHALFSNSIPLTDDLTTIARQVFGDNTTQSLTARNVSSDNTTENLTARNVSSDNTTENLTARNVYAENTTESLTARNVYADNTTESLTARNVYADNTTENLTARNVYADNTTESLTARKVYADNTTESLTARNVYADNTTESLTARQVLENNTVGLGNLVSIGSQVSNDTDTESVTVTARPVLADSTETSHDAGVSYGILLDAGSSSTKLKIYRWSKPESGPSVPNVTLMPLDKSQRKFKPGLAELEGLDAIRTYLANILQVAQGLVPAAKHAGTPLFVLATAGFRLLGVSSAREGMQDVEQILLNSSVHPFRFSAGGASVLSGEEEAAYAWIAANYLLGFFTGNRPDSDSVGILEMGGGSTQIAFIPRDPLMAEEFQVIIGGKRYSLYAQSYLHFGLDAIRERLEGQVVSAAGCNTSTVNQPCMLTGDSEHITACGNLTVMLQGTGSPIECKRLFDELLASAPPENCFLEPCAIGSVFQPSVEGIDFYAISSFVYSLEAAGVVGRDGTLDLRRLFYQAQQYCSKNLSEYTERDRDFASANCMQALYTNELFTKPYGFQKTTNRIKVTNKIHGNDV